MEDWSLDKCLCQFGKGYSSSGCEETQFRFFGHKQIFGLSRISIFLSTLIIILINLIITNPPSIKLILATPSFAITINPDYTFLGLC